MTEADEETCQCWGCRAPKFLHKTDIPFFLSDCYALYHSIPVAWKHFSDRWFIFQDAPDVVVSLWADMEVAENDSEAFKTLVEAAREEEKARGRRNA